MQAGRRPTGRHEAGASGSIPGPATADRVRKPAKRRGRGPRACGFDSRPGHCKQRAAHTSETSGPLVQREDAWFAPRQSGFDSPAVHLRELHLRKVAGYGWPGRFAKPCDLRVMWVQIPCLPLNIPMVQRTARDPPKVRILVRVRVGILKPDTHPASVPDGTADYESARRGSTPRRGVRQ